MQSLMVDLTIMDSQYPAILTDSVLCVCYIILVRIEYGPYVILQKLSLCPCLSN